MKGCPLDFIDPATPSAFEPGSHASTLGGNPLAMAADIATIQILQRENLAQQNTDQGVYFR